MEFYSPEKPKMLPCSICKEDKPKIDFHKNSSAPSGRDTRCIPCKKEARDKVRKTDEYREFDKARHLLWKQNNPEIYALGRHLRRVKEKSQVASWVRDNPDELKKIAEMHKKAFELAEAYGFEFHVDHIVPLNSKLVCGFTCSVNLEPLSREANLKKSNRVWPDMPDDPRALIEEFYPITRK